MTRRPVALSLALALSASFVLPGCDRTSHLTEQQHIQRAKDFEDQGKLNSSIIELKNAIQKNPDSPQARLLLGQVYLKNGAGAAAEKELTRARKLGVSGETLKPLLGDALLMMGEYKRVLDEINPGEQTSRVNLARIYQIRAEAMLRQGKTEEACNLFQQSYETDKRHPATYWGLANCAVIDQNLTKARDWLDQALKLGTQEARTWIGIGNLEQFQKNQPGALAAFSNALKLEPNNLDALQNRAALNLGLGKLDAAKSDIDAINRLAPRSLPAHYLKALLDFEQKRFAEARSALDEVFKLTPDHMPSVLLAGATAHELGSYQQAESLLNRFLSRFPHHAYARRILASTQNKQNQPDRALDTLAPLVQPESNDVSALVLASDAYRLKGDAGRTAAYLERAAALDPGNAYIQTQLGLSHLSAGNNQLAIAELSQAAARDSSQYRADYALVMTYLGRKEFDKALTAIDRLEKKLKNSPLTQTMRGSAVLGKKDFAAARRHFEAALAIDPTFVPAAASLAQLDMHDKRPDDARKRFERILGRDKNNLQAMMALANLAAIENRQSASIDWLERAARIHPAAIAPRAALIRIHLDRNQGQKALALANETVNANPDNPAALDLLGSVQLAINDSTSAASTFTRLTQKVDQAPDALVQLAAAQLAANRENDARASLERALKLDPAHPATLDALIKLEMKAGQPEKALRLARQLQAQQPRLPLGFEREGDILLVRKQPAQAANAYEKAYSIDKSQTARFVKFHRALSLAGQTPTADQLLSGKLKSAPQDTALQIYAAEVLVEKGRRQDAVTQYVQALRNAPNDATLLNNLAALYQTMGHSQALPTAERAYKLAPGNPAIQDTFGWILVENGQAARGLPLIEQSVARLSRNPSVRYHHAVALARTGKRAQARAELDRLLKETPSFPESEAARVLLQSL